MGVIEVDPKVQAAFDERIAAARRANAEVAGALDADRERLAAEAREREARAAADRDRLRDQAEQVAAKGDKQQRQPQWSPGPQRGAGEMAFGPEDDDEAAPPPPPRPTPPPVVHQPPPPPPVSRHRRAAPVEEDDDLSGQSWLT